VRSPTGGSWCSRADSPLSTPSELLGEGPFGALLAVLERSRQLGLLGPGPVEQHVARALDALRFVPERAHRALDLGSGGGLPGLPLALARPAVPWVLLDGSVKRGDFLREAVERLGLTGQVEVVTARAEEAGRRPELRGGFDVVVARSFGPAAVTAECAAPFLQVGGCVVVAEPPGGALDRWPPEGLSLLGLRAGIAVSEPSAFQVLVQETPCPDRYPRRTGIPTKRPLF
jgi:16S rRNA (guanine527-N7)-methyltransferase